MVPLPRPGIQSPGRAAPLPPAVYGPIPDAELRLITWGGAFDPQLGSYLSNTVVYAVQVSENPE
jgi:hypothetical protein